LYWSFVRCFLVLTWLGSCPAEAPFTGVALAISVIYFILIFLLIL
jgi:hypothetical protein